MKIICVGRNYAAHAAELNNDVPSEPLIFIKPDTALLINNQDFYLPEFSSDIHFECEVVYRISRQGKYISRKFARSYLDGIGLGIDFTARDVQKQCKEKGLPWTKAKCFNHSAPISTFLEMEEVPNLADLLFELKVNGVSRQNGHTADMIFPIEKLIEYVSSFITLKKGDMIYTGTPEGVGKVEQGDYLQGFLEGRLMFDFHVK